MENFALVPPLIAIITASLVEWWWCSRNGRARWCRVAVAGEVIDADGSPVFSHPGQGGFQMPPATWLALRRRGERQINGSSNPGG